VLFPILGYFRKNLTAVFIPYSLRIPVFPYRRIYSLPNIPLLSGPAFSAKRQFSVISFLNGGRNTT
jgi:hypothetical protein